MTLYSGSITSPMGFWKAQVSNDNFSGDLIDISALISTGPNIYESQKILLSEIALLLKPRARTVTLVKGSNNIVYGTAFPAGTTVIIIPFDKDGIGLGAITVPTIFGFTIEAGLAGDFSYIATSEI